MEMAETFRFATSNAPGRAMASIINDYDWESHALGPIVGWPNALKQTVSMMLASRFPMYLAWGTKGYSLYNDGYVSILGNKHPHAIGASLDIVWGELEENIRDLIRKTYQDESSYFEDLPVQLQRHGFLENCYFTFSNSAVRGDTGEIEGFFSVCIDTTQAFQHKQKRINEGERLRRLFQQAPGFFAVTIGPSHIIEIANEAYSALIGHRKVLGKAVGEALPEAAEQGFVTLLDDVYRTGAPYVGTASQYNVARHPGEPLVEIYVDFVYQPILNEAAEVIGIVIQGHEVTESHMARKKLIQADRQKHQFIATLAHELRNPIAPISAAADILMTPNLSSESVTNVGAIIGRQVKNMSKLLDDLLDVARISNNQINLVKERVTIEKLISTAIETVQPLIDRKKHIIEVKQEESIEIEADVVRVTQIISNLIYNSAKYTHEEGKIVVSVHRVDDQCEIEVEDNGIGIEADTLETVFNMFSQDQGVVDRSEGGLGIGLSLVKGLVELHGGTVTAHSEGCGKGSRFTISLPCISSAGKIKKHQKISEDSPVRALKILLADDNEDLISALTALFQMQGHEIETATDGSKALERAKSFQPDVAILDIGMPDMTGYDLARAIRSEPWGKGILLIAATGWGSEADRNKARLAGFDRHITKPFSVVQINEIFKKFLENLLE